ncbi:MAG: hypothetical protein WCW27_06785 [Patescibacteria group bacterium]|jgi:hypothetical protein
MQELINTYNTRARGLLRLYVSMPFIYVVFIPLVLLDIIVELYHHVVFPLYGLPLVPRAKHVVLDRYKLDYLSWSEKINCLYCEYANGLINYIKEIAGETEKMWCPIKHKWSSLYQPPEHQATFSNYNDEAMLAEYLEKRSQATTENIATIQQESQS